MVSEVSAEGPGLGMDEQQDADVMESLLARSPTWRVPGIRACTPHPGNITKLKHHDHVASLRRLRPSFCTFSLQQDSHLSLVSQHQRRKTLRPQSMTWAPLEGPALKLHRLETASFFLSLGVSCQLNRMGVWNQIQFKLQRKRGNQ